MAAEPDKPSPARMYDYFLGGYHNFAIDRQAAEQIIALYPDASLAARTNRAFLRRAVTFLAQQGVDQFLDLGSGIPTAGHVHEVAQRIHSDTRVVYVDIDPVAVAFSQNILQETPSVVAIAGDVRMPDEVLNHSEVQRVIDFGRPLAILMVALLQFVPNDGEAQRVVEQLLASAPVGSYLALSHVTNEYLPAEVREQSEAIYARSTNPSKLRSQAQIARLFAGLDLVEPGIVLVPQWRPGASDDLFLDAPERSMFFAGVGRKS